MPEETGTATQTEPETTTDERVEKPEAVLAKNKELLGVIAREKKEREALATRISEFEKAETDRQQKALEKKGDYDKLRENMEKSHTDAIAAEKGRYDALFTNASRYQLAVEIGKHEPLEGTSERLAKLLLLDEIKPTEEEGKVVWRRIDTDEKVSLKEFIPSIKEAYGEYFKADNVPGGDAPGNTGKTNGSGKKWADMSRSDRNDAIRAAGGDIEAAKKKHS
jgi:hypothetical protein